VGVEAGGIQRHGMGREERLLAAAAATAVPQAVGRQAVLALAVRAGDEQG
jgi:hypothetical protein